MKESNPGFLNVFPTSGIWMYWDDYDDTAWEVILWVIRYISSLCLILVWNVVNASIWMTKLLGKSRSAASKQLGKDCVDVCYKTWAWMSLKARGWLSSCAVMPNLITTFDHRSSSKIRHSCRNDWTVFSQQKQVLNSCPLTTSWRKKEASEEPFWASLGVSLVFRKFSGTGNDTGVRK